jgi:ribosome-associated protein
MKSRVLAYFIAEFAEAKLAENIVIADMRNSSPLADFFVVCSVKSAPQLKAVAAEIIKKLSKEGIKPKKEGVFESGWVVLDFGFVVVHIMHERIREYYALEQIWDKKAVMYHL